MLNIFINNNLRFFIMNKVTNMHSTRLILIQGLNHIHVCRVLKLNVVYIFEQLNDIQTFGVLYCIFVLFIILKTLFVKIMFQPRRLYKQYIHAIPYSTIVFAFTRICWVPEGICVSQTHLVCITSEPKILSKFSYQNIQVI